MKLTTVNILLIVLLICICIVGTSVAVQVHKAQEPIWDTTDYTSPSAQVAVQILPPESNSTTEP